MQYVWSPVYVDTMIMRDRDTNANGSLDERLWVQQDANWNVTALLDNSGTVLERFAYDGFGNFVTYNASYTIQSGGSNYSWVYQHQGLRYDFTITAIDNRRRWYDPDFGRFMQLDPLRFEAGDANLYRYERNAATNWVDPSGLDEKPKPSMIHHTGKPHELKTDGNWHILPAPNKWSTLDCVAVVSHWEKPPGRPAGSHLFQVQAKKCWYGHIPKGEFVGPEGCGPCVGLVLIPKKPGDPTFVFHYSMFDQVFGSLEQAQFLQNGRPRPGYSAVLCGCDLNDSGVEAALHTLSDTVTMLKFQGIPIKCYVAGPGFAVDDRGTIYWTTPATLGLGGYGKK